MESLVIISLHNFWIQWWKNFEKWSTVGQVMGKSRASFLTRGEFCVLLSSKCYCMPYCYLCQAGTFYPASVCLSLIRITHELVIFFWVARCLTSKRWLDDFGVEKWKKNHNPNLTPAGESARCETGGSLNFTLLGWQSRLAHCIVLNCTKGSFSNLGSSTKDVHQNTGKIDTLPLSALVHNLSPSCRRPQTWLNTRWTVTHGHPVITRCL